MLTYKIYAAGRWLDTNEMLPVARPYDGQVFAEVGVASPGHLELAIQSAAAVQKEFGSMPGHRRSSILKEIAGRMEDVREALARLLCQEAGKPLRYALIEVDRAIQTFRIASEEARRLPGEYLPIDWTPSGEGKEGWLRYFPVGLVGAISPFNFPLNLSAHKIAPALAAGCPIILKPASQTPVSILELARIISQAGLPDGALSIMPMKRETGNLLVTDNRIKLLTFTGSPEVGWKMKNDAGQKRVVLELGGNAGVLVTDPSRMEMAVAKCVTGAFAYSGQVCIHVQRIFILEPLFDDFIRRFLERTASLVAGDPMDPATDISVMIDETNAIRVESWIGEAVAGGARILAGGKRKGSYVQPTVITGTTPDMKVCAREVFGPVVVIEPVGSFEEGLAMINDSKYGLQAGVFTHSLDEMNRAFSDLEVGGVIINDVPSFRVDHMPYGGVKDSGFGREGVRYAMMDMLEPRLLVKNR
jgi:glyceraldehyde-3-phosphate dehydrogenase (NADP+)